MATDDKKIPEAAKAPNHFKLIVITGASSGIGEACVMPFLKNGYSILMLARNLKSMEESKKKIISKVSKETGQGMTKLDPLIYIKQCDVTLEEPKKTQDNSEIDMHSIDSAIKEVLTSNKDKNMFVDCIINNAGFMMLSSVEDQPLKDVNTMLNININGVLNGMKAVITGMKQRKHGTIINISSIAGKKHFDNHTVYCATKCAVEGLTEGLRQELACHNVKVSAICPGAVETNLLAPNTEEVISDYEEWKNTMELGALMPEDVSNACYFVYNQHPRCCIRELQIAPVNQVQ